MNGTPDVRVASTPSEHVVDGVHHLDELALEHGGTLRNVHVAWRSIGEAHAPPVLVLGGISAHRDPTEWWRGVAGDDAPLDPARYRLLSVDWLGGRGDSSRPRHAGDWPALSTRDQAAALLDLLQALGATPLHAVVGASYGGMVALALAALAPGCTERVVCIAAAHRSHPFATAQRSVQRRIVRLGLDAGRADVAVGVARALAVTTYRTAREFGRRFGDAPHVNGSVSTAVDPYLDRHAARYADSFPGACYLALSESLDLHRVDTSVITAACTFVGLRGDALVPEEDVKAAATATPRSRFVSIESVYGHDGFLKEEDAVGAVIRTALRTPPQAASAHVHASATRAVRAGLCSDTQHGAVIPPLHMSSTFSFESLGVKRAYDYTRSGNPTRDVLGSAVAELECGTSGIVTATGMAAINVVLSLLGPDDTLVAPHDMYGGTWRLIDALRRRRAFHVEIRDLTRTDAPDQVRRLRPRMVWIETPSNPLLRITDIAAISAAAHDVGATVVADNTFLSPALQQPLLHGADVVVHSTTKYLNGHSDVVGGAVVATDRALGEQLAWWANCIGATGSPFDAWLTLRGIRTLHARMRLHEDNAAAVASLLEGHTAVRRVYYPGLASHPGHDIARAQQAGHGGMIAFELDDEAAVRRLVQALRCFTLAESLGGVESLVAHPATMTHASMDAAARATAGITDGLVRLSVGIEAGEDLVADLRQALDRVTCTRTSCCRRP